MQQFDIYRITKAWNGCGDARPWMIIEVRPRGVFGCFPIAAETYGATQCFRVDPLHPDFIHTGLTKECHVHHGLIYEVPAAVMLAGQRRGHMRNNLLEFFRHMTDL